MVIKLKEETDVRLFCEISDFYQKFLIFEKFLVSCLAIFFAVREALQRFKAFKTAAASFSRRNVARREFCILKAFDYNSGLFSGSSRNYFAITDQNDTGN